MNALNYQVRTVESRARARGPGVSGRVFYIDYFNETTPEFPYDATTTTTTT